MTVSVIIVTYDSGQEIGPCLESVVPQVEAMGGEVVIVDNASIDGTLATVESFRGGRTTITVIRNEKNIGFTRANNQGLRVAHGDFIFFLNPDTELEPGVIESLADMLRKDETLGAVAPQLRFTDGQIQHSCRRFPKYGWVISELLGLSRLFPTSRRFNGWKMGDFDHRSTREVNQPAAAALMVRGDLLQQMGGLDERFPMFFSDVDLCHRIWKKKRILFCPEAVVIHKGGVSVNREKARMIISSHISFICYFNKYYTGPLNRMMNLPMAVLLSVSMVIRSFWATTVPERFRSKRLFL